MLISAFYFVWAERHLLTHALRAHTAPLHAGEHGMASAMSDGRAREMGGKDTRAHPRCVEVLGEVGRWPEAACSTIATER